MYMECAKMKHIYVAHLCLQDEAKSNKLRVRRVETGDNLVDIGKKALSHQRKSATSMVCNDAQENIIKSGDVRRCQWVLEWQIRADQRSSNQQNAIEINWWPFQTTAVLGDSQASMRTNKRGNSKPDASPFCGLFPQAYCLGLLQFFLGRILGELVCG